MADKIIELDGEQVNISEMTVAETDTFILDCVLVRGMSLSEVAALFGRKKVEIEKSIQRAIATMKELNIDAREMQTLSIQLLIRRVQAAELTLGGIDQLTRLHSLLAKLQGTDKPPDAEKVITVYVGADSAEADAAAGMTASREFHLPGGKVMKFPAMREVHIQPAGEDEDGGS